MNTWLEQNGEAYINRFRLPDRSRVGIRFTGRTRSSSIPMGRSICA
jgi:hypothetical protein